MRFEHRLKPHSNKKQRSLLEAFQDPNLYGQYYLSYLHISETTISFPVLESRNGFVDPVQKLYWNKSFIVNIQKDMSFTV